jgi:uncharacterized protein YfeS
MNKMQKLGIQDAHETLEHSLDRIKAKKKGDVFDYVGAYIGHMLQMVYVTVESEADKATAVEVVNKMFEQVTEHLGGTGIDVACMVKE